MARRPGMYRSGSAGRSAKQFRFGAVSWGLKIEETKSLKTVTSWESGTTFSSSCPCYRLVMTNIAIENDHRNSGFFPLKMVTFHSYVSLPEGSCPC